MAHNYSIIVALIAAGLLAASIGSLRMLKRALTELHLEFQQQIDALSAKVGALERKTGSQNVAPIPPQSLNIVPPAANVVEPDAAQVPEEITAETLTMIAETVTALLGKKIRIRSVRVVQQDDTLVDPWAQQGRVVVQASHNLARRGYE